MADRALAQSLIQKALDLFETSALFNRRAAMKCHISGLQGEKRRARYLFRKSQYIVDCLQHSTVDLFDPILELYPNVGSIDISSMVTPKACMEKIISTLWKIHDDAQGIANDMVIAKFNSLREPIDKFCDCIMTIIAEMNRNYRSYEAAAWEWHHVSRHQETDCNIHDKYEDKEEQQGYKDHKEA